ncbi:hypothetical protein [Streptomyces bobili]|uniref:hypothetical protein n=1 Tax=Streptomyces bobili TaxID=67280 RepID=UPI00379BCFA1
MPAETASTPTVDAHALIMLPPLDGLSEEQLRGAACIWCSEGLTTDTAVDLGERRHRRLDGHYSTFPRGCRTHGHRAMVQAIHDHAGMCEQCVDAPETCDLGMALVRLEKAARP